MVYVHMASQDIHIIPDLTLALEEFATAKIAANINGSNMSIAYHEAEKQPRMFERIGDLSQVFHTYLGRVCENNGGAIGGLSNLINQFRDTPEWPTRDEHYHYHY